MGFEDPFFGYSFILRTILYVVIPAFTVLQFMRLRRAVHVYQLESYKPHWFRRWCKENPRRALFLKAFREAKKPLVMTGRAWRMLVTATVFTVALLLLPTAAAHLIGGAPWDLLTFAAMTVLAFYGAPWLVLAADSAMKPVQSLINGRYLRMAGRKLRDVHPLVVGITGSYGKTSTKSAVAGLIGPSHEVLATPGSFNTPLGISRTINEHLDESHGFFVVEMGARQEGDIAELCGMVSHRIGVLTSIGRAHLETFGSPEAISRGKYEIVRSLPADGVAIMNVDDPEVRRWADETSHCRVVRVGLDPAGAPDITARDVEVRRGGTTFMIRDARSDSSVQVNTKLLGSHSVSNILLAVAVAVESGRKLEDLAGPITGLQAVEHRLQVIEGAGGVTVIDDAYNSNPSGAAAALEVLRAMPGEHKVVISPGMVELGSAQVEENERFGELASEVADTVIFVASLNREALARGARRAGTPADVITVDSLTEATERLKTLLKPGDVVLFENDLPDQYEGR
jgi:UDP-N-acetylmuramoyl-tripeptide--D-alanyl-D-alanine ligase